MAESRSVGPWGAAIAIGLLWLSSSAETHASARSSAFLTALQSSSATQQETRPEQDNTESNQRVPAPADLFVLQPDLNGIIESPFQPDPSSGLMTLDVVVTDQMGKSIAGLGKKDFTLLDNGSPRDIVTFRAFDNAAFEPTPPVKVILVIDEVDLPELLIGAAEQDAQKFLLQNGGRLAQETMVYRISNDGLFAASQPSTDGNALAREVGLRNEPRTIWKSKELLKPARKSLFESDLNSFVNSTWVGLPQSLIALGSIAIEERRTPERKLLFWIGSAWPTGQKQRQRLFDTVTELSTRLREARLGIWVDDFSGKANAGAFPHRDFAAGATSEDSLAPENLALRVLAVQSGGGVLQGEGEAADLISRQVAQANMFYTITFDPLRTDVVDEYHDLKVEISKPGLTASTCTGYYNEPVYYDQARADVKDVTVAQLRESIDELQGASDSKTEQHLERMELTERLSSSELAKWLATLKGPKAQRALTAIADQSVFYPPPAEDTLAVAPPSIADQNKLIQRTVDYVSKTIPLLPNLIANRTTTLYTEPQPAQDLTWKTAAGDHYLEPVRITEAEVRVSDGKEGVQELHSSSMRPFSENKWLQTEGTFGPILASLLVAVAKPESKLLWARWEKGDNGPLAVFRYFIPKDTPIFKVGFCCMAVDSARINFETHAPSHGEITIDPTTGTILRFTLRAGLAWRLPLQRADIMVEYGPVILGEKSYICPVRSVSISRPRSVVQVSEFGEVFKVYAPFEMLLNDMEYGNYHLFRSTSRMLPGFGPPQ
jgi:hypothetical protein